MSQEWHDSGGEGNREGRDRLRWGILFFFKWNTFFAVLEHGTFGRSAFFFFKSWYYFYKASRTISCLTEWIIFRLWHKSYKNLLSSFHLWYMCPNFILTHLFLTRESSDLENLTFPTHVLAFIFGRPKDKYGLMPAWRPWIQEFQKKTQSFLSFSMLTTSAEQMSSLDVLV